jgi:hypothetical protein
MARKQQLFNVFTKVAPLLLGGERSQTLSPAKRASSSGGGNCPAMLSSALQEDPDKAGKMLGGAAARALHVGEDPLLRPILENGIAFALTFARGRVPTEQLLPKAQEAVNTVTTLLGKPPVDLVASLCSAGQMAATSISKRIKVRR